MPSRVTTKYLAERGELPSRLSKYKKTIPLAVSTPKSTTHSNAKDAAKKWVEGCSNTSWDNVIHVAPAPVPLGVYLIQYTQQEATSNGNSNRHKFDGISCHHGFGASSLSWLPVLPSLVNRLGSSRGVGLAHDAPGFGFTDRPNTNDDNSGLYQYGYENNVGIALTLLKDAFSGSSSSSSTKATKLDDHDAKSIASRSIVIFGHSMGSKTALLMALHCASQEQLQLKPNLVVLVGPVLEGVSLPSRPSILPSTGPPKQQSKSTTRKMARRVRDALLGTPLQYGLRQRLLAQGLNACMG